MKLITISILVLYCSLLNSQTIEKPEKNYWLNSGIGIYCAPRSAGFTWNVMSLQQIHKTSSWKIKLMYSEELNILGPSPSEHFYEADFLLGKLTGGNSFHFSVHGGLGFIGGVTRGEPVNGGDDGFFRTTHYEKENIGTFCVPVEASLNTTGTENRIGMGVTVYGNINTIASQWGITLGIFIRLD